MGNYIYNTNKHESKVNLTLKWNFFNFDESKSGLKPHQVNVTVDDTQKVIDLIKYVWDGYDVNCIYCKKSRLYLWPDNASISNVLPPINQPKLQLDKTIADNGIKSGNTIFFKHELYGHGAAYALHHSSVIIFYKIVKKEILDNGRVIYYQGEHENAINLIHYHVSCKSDIIPKQLTSNTNMIGIILYKYDGKTDWFLNNVHCKTGYVIIKNAKSLDKIDTIRGTMHSKLYKLIFNEDLDDEKTLQKEIIGAGFAIQNGILKFNSYTFNANGKDDYHNGKKVMHVYEAIGIHSILQKWQQTNVQTWSVWKLNHATYFKDYCREHLIFSFLKDDIDDIGKWYKRGCLVKNPFSL
eukprot:258798_1